MTDGRTNRGSMVEASDASLSHAQLSASHEEMRLLSAARAFLREQGGHFAPVRVQPDLGGLRHAFAVEDRS